MIKEKITRSLTEKHQDQPQVRSESERNSTGKRSYSLPMHFSNIILILISTHVYLRLEQRNINAFDHICRVAIVLQMTAIDARYGIKQNNDNRVPSI